MKRLFAIITLIVLLLPTASALAMVAAAYDGLFTLIHFESNGFGLTSDNTVITDDDGTDPGFSWTRRVGTITSHHPNIYVYLKYHGELYATGTGTVYYRVTAPDVTGVSIGTNNVLADGLPETYPTSGSFTYDHGELRKRIQVFSSSSLYYNQTVNVNGRIELSMTPFENDSSCGESYLLGAPIVEAAEIDPTIEFPVGSPTDTQKATTVIGNTYRVSASGLWDAGASVNREDFSYSLDGSTWDNLLNLRETALCSDDDGIIFTASSDEFYLRVNDTAGNFANNTEPNPETDPLLWSLFEIDIPTEFQCASQFNVDYDADPFAAGDLAPTSSDVIATAFGTNQAAQFTVGNYYAIRTSGGPYYNGQSPDPQYGIEIQLKAQGWVNAVPGEGVVGISCITQDGDYLTIFWQSDNSLLHLRVADGDANWANNTGDPMEYEIFPATMTNRFVSTCESLFETGDFIGLGSVDARSSDGSEMSSLSDAMDRPVTTSSTLEGYSPTDRANRYFAVDVFEGPWLDASPNSYSYDAEIGMGTRGVSMNWHVVNEPESTLFRCVAKLDEYHYRVYFMVDPLDLNDEFGFYFRVHDQDDPENYPANYLDNSGRLGYMAYLSDYFGNNIPEDGPTSATACDAYTLPASPVASATVQADSSTGTFMPGVPEPGTVMAIETTGGPWLDNGAGDDRYDLQISDDNGETWVKIWKYPGVRCANTTGDHYMTLYLTPLEYRTYKFRVNDAGEVFTGNTGSLGINVYNLTEPTTQTPGSSWASCGENYTLTPISSTGLTPVVSVSAPIVIGALGDYLISQNASTVSTAIATLGNAVIGTVMGSWAPYLGVQVEARTIMANSSNGIAINPALQPGGAYGIMSLGGPWYDSASSTDAEYSLDISDDNGATWEPFDEYSESNCVMDRNLYTLMLFVVPSDAGTYRLRVRDSGENYVWMDNRDNMNFLLFGVSVDGHSSGEIDPTKLHSLPGNRYCNGSCTIPRTWLASVSFSIPGVSVPITIPGQDPWSLGWPEVPIEFGLPDLGAWFSYFLCSITQFVTWCPAHTQAVLGIIGAITQYEPFATINDILSLYTYAFNEIASYNWPSPMAVGGQGDVWSMLGEQANQNNGQLVWSGPTSETVYLSGLGGGSVPWTTTICGSSLRSLMNASGENDLLTGMVGGACWTQMQLLTPEALPLAVGLLTTQWFASIVLTMIILDKSLARQNR